MLTMRDLSRSPIVAFAYALIGNTLDLILKPKPSKLAMGQTA